jgi:PAS domain S-box-containing protein
VSAHQLADALLTLPWLTDWNDRSALDHPDYEPTDMVGSALEALNTAVAFAVPSGPLASAVGMQCPLRGHGSAALLATRDPTPDLTAEGRCVAAAVFAILCTTLGFMLRKREFARRLKQVRGAKIAWEGTVDALPQIVCVLDKDGMVTRANRGIETWGLGSVTSAPFGTLHELLHPGCTDSRCGLASRLATALARISPNRNQQFEHADPLLGRDLRVKVGQVTSQSGQSGPRPGIHRFAVVEDISRERSARRKIAQITQDLKRTVDHHSLALTATHKDLDAATIRLVDIRLELEETRRRHRLVLENTSAGLLMVKGGRVAYCNARFEDLLGYAKGELADAPVEDLLPPGSIPARTVHSVDCEPLTAQERVCQFTRKNGTTIWVRRAFAEFVTDDGPIRFITVIDVTDQILAERALHASRRELQQLSQCLISSQEDERRRIASELHDGIGQSLSAVKLMLQNVRADALGQGDSRLAKPLMECVDKTQEMIEDVRRLSMALRPAIIDSGGVLLALTRLCQELKDSMRGLAVHWSTDVNEGEVDEDLKIHLFRIVQESLNNVIKHARASNVWIRLDRCDRRLRLTIRDDGVGFDPAALAGHPGGLGLSSMKQRATLHGGKLTIESEPGRGTTVCAVWGDLGAMLEATGTL